jgi:hypothetical protein
MKYYKQTQNFNICHTKLHVAVPWTETCSFVWQIHYSSVALDCNTSFLITFSELVEGIFEILDFYNSDYVSDFLRKRNLGNCVYETSFADG